eukprot:TRINITY_DN17329_c0_g1_i1.p1 TRINITY_DN17329_c0_g1~~TRINITY_DN17329_c0_g1_i1.p1  ORF type:complete len:215 (+),score=37.66 TRINITY_DN17329_c0_g1_i1:56-646(+)
MLRYLFLLLAVHVISAAKPGNKDLPPWKRFTRNKETIRRLRCSACLCFVEDAMAHLQIIDELRGVDASEDDVFPLVRQMCASGEQQFWALKWTEHGLVEPTFLKRYDIDVQDKQNQEVAAHLGEDPPESYFGTSEQKQWAKEFFLKTCDEIFKLSEDKFMPWVRSRQTLAYPEHCPLEECKNELPRYLQKFTPDEL